MQYWVVGNWSWGWGFSDKSKLCSDQRSYQAVGPCLSRLQCHFFLQWRYAEPEMSAASGADPVPHSHSFVAMPKFVHLQVPPLLLLRTPFGNGGTESVEILGTDVRTTVQTVCKLRQS